MGTGEKKANKARVKLLKKQAKADQKAAKDGKLMTDKPSRAVVFAEGVRGVIFLVTAVSMGVAVFLSDKGYIIKMEDIFNSLAVAMIGKVVLIVIAVALFIYGLKSLRAIK